MKQVFRVLNDMVRDGAIPNYAIGGAIGAVFDVESFSTQDLDVIRRDAERQSSSKIGRSNSFL